MLPRILTIMKSDVPLKKLAQHTPPWNMAEGGNK